MGLADRQSGKTTLLRHEYGGQSDYLSFDDPLETEFAHADPVGFLKAMSALGVGPTGRPTVGAPPRRDRAKRSEPGG